MNFSILPNGQLAIVKDPQASLVYGLDVTDVLATGDAVAGASVAASSGVTVGAADYNGNVVSVRVSGGSVGTAASVTLRWTTALGDIDERTINFRIAQR
jgi:uncharacterized protein (DUF697 family)